MYDWGTRMGLFWIMLWGCSSPTERSHTAITALEIEAKVQNHKVASGEKVALQVELYGPLQQELQYSGPQAVGLQVLPSDPLELAQIGARQRKTLFYSLQGADGSYIIEPGTLQVGQEKVVAAAIFVDIGTGLPEAKLANPADRQKEARWWYVVAIGLLLLLLVGGWKLRKRQPDLALSAAQQALQQWEKAKKKQLDEHALAVQLSSIFRTYLDAVFGCQTLNLSPDEARQWLLSAQHLRPNEQDPARRLLEATDQIKFAGVVGGHELFDRLGRDLVWLISTIEARTQQP